MCQTAVYLVREGKEELVLQDVVNITPEGATLKLVSLFGEEKGGLCRTVSVWFGYVSSCFQA